MILRLAKVRFLLVHVFVLLFIVSCAGAAGVSAFAASGGTSGARGIEVRINGLLVEFPDQQPFIAPETQRAYVPLRFVSEALGADVGWDGAAKAALVQAAGKDIRMPVDTAIARVNGKETPLDAPARLVGGRTMVPLRFVSEVLGARVDWVAPEGGQPGQVLIATTREGRPTDGGSPGSWTLEVGASDGRTRLVIESPEPFKHRVFTLTGPDRLVIDLVGVPGGETPPGTDLRSEAVERVRTGRPVEDPPTGRVVCDLAAGLGFTRYQVEVDAARRLLTVEVWTVDRVLDGRVIVLDPGHGGSDPGAIGPTGFMEKDFNLATAQEAARLLRKEGAEVVLTRTTDVRLGATTAEDLEKRSRIANDHQADLFVSIHANASVSPATQGTEVYYYAHPENQAANLKLARALQASLVRELGRKDRGVKASNFFVLRNIEMPGALIETAFISNPEEEGLLAQDWFQKQAAAAIVDGIKAYFQGDL